MRPTPSGRVTPIVGRAKLGKIFKQTEILIVKDTLMYFQKVVLSYQYLKLANFIFPSNIFLDFISIWHKFKF